MIHYQNKKKKSIMKQQFARDAERKIATIVRVERTR